MSIVEPTDRADAGAAKAIRTGVPLGNPTDIVQSILVEALS